MSETRCEIERRLQTDEGLGGCASLAENDGRDEADEGRNRGPPEASASLGSNREAIENDTGLVLHSDPQEEDTGQGLGSYRPKLVLRAAQVQAVVTQALFSFALWVVVVCSGCEEGQAPRQETAETQQL